MEVKKALMVYALLGVASVMVHSQEGKDVYCGRKLALKLALLCENGMLMKRSEQSPFNALMVHEKPYSWPWIPPYRARSLERKKRQVVSECCEKPCTIDEIMSYCA